jgi:hypothetical protein
MFLIGMGSNRESGKYMQRIKRQFFSGKTGPYCGPFIGVFCKLLRYQKISDSRAALHLSPDGI